MNLVYAAFDTFGTIQALTQGGPGKETETLVDEGVSRRHGQLRSRLLVGAVGGADGRRDRADRGRSSASSGRQDGRDEAAARTGVAQSCSAFGVLLFALPVWLVLAGSTQDPTRSPAANCRCFRALAGFSIYPRVLTAGAMRHASRSGTCC